MRNESLLSPTYSLEDGEATIATHLLGPIPPYVRTELMGARQVNDPMAMPLEDFIPPGH